MSGFSWSGRFYLVFANLVIISILGVQLVGGFTFPRADYWPFLTYPMYSGPRYEGERFREYSLYAETASGERIALKAEDFGYSYWLFRENAHEVVLNGRVPQALLADVCARHGGDLAELVLEDTGYFITRHGPEAGPPEELRRVPVSCSDREMAA